MALNEGSEIQRSGKSKVRFSISLRWLMIFGFGTLVAVSIGLVLFLTLRANIANTISSLNARGVLMLDSMERSIRSETNQAERLVLAVVNLYQDENLIIGPMDKDQRSLQQATLKSLIIASPVVEAILVYDLEGHRSGVFHDSEGNFSRIPFGLGDRSEVDALLAGSERAEKNGDFLTPIWGEPVRLNNILFHNVALPLMKNGKAAGVVVAAIGQNNMNRIVVNLGEDNNTSVFVLTQNDEVIAHSRQPGIFKDRGRIKLEDFPDPAMQQFKNAKKVNRFGIAKNKGIEVFQTLDNGDQDGHVFLIRSLEGYSEQPYRLGAYFGESELGSEFERIIISATAGLAALVLAVVAAGFLSRRLTTPMKKIAAVARDFSALKLDQFVPLPPSRIREIDEQSLAMNSMHNALTEFSQYVPRTIVKRLMEPGSDPMRSVEREVTIIFADIAGFTRISEDLNAVETASLINAHFDRICHAINRHKGTVDKFIGDGIMAFWGAPEIDNEQAQNAISAAIDITKILEENNLVRTSQNLPPLRLRIGIHTGQVVVGNIGSCDRQNYTIVGDAVNVANRLESFGKMHMGDAQTIICVSGDTWRAANGPEELKSIGMHKLRGREKAIEVFVMLTGADDKTAAS